MRTKGKETLTPAIGIISLIVVFITLSLTVFALLSLTTVVANARLSKSCADSVESYYEAYYNAQNILSKLREGNKVEGVEIYGNEEKFVEYSCDISDNQELRVEAIINEDGEYEIKKWQVEYTGSWETDDSIEVWDGIYMEGIQ